MPYKIEILPVVLEQLAALEKTDQSRLTQQIGLLATNPRPRAAKSLEDSPAVFRLRSGNYRILYTVDDDARVVLIVKIARRREVNPSL